MTPASNTRLHGDGTCTIWPGGPPQLDRSVWEDPEVREAVDAEDFGKLVRAYRRLAGDDGRPAPELRAAHWLGIGVSRLRILETGPACPDVASMARWAKTLGVPADLLWFPLNPNPDPGPDPGSGSIPPARGPQQ